MTQSQQPIENLFEPAVLSKLVYVLALMTIQITGFAQDVPVTELEEQIVIEGFAFKDNLGRDTPCRETECG